MAGPNPRDDYTPVPQVSPTIGMPEDYQTTQANPNEFGAQIGAAKEKLGAAVTDVGTKAVDIATQYQGVLNETASNLADLALATNGGKVYSQYKMNEGFDAVNNKDKAIQDYMAVHQQIRSTLNPAAARAYDQLANRRISYTIQDMNDYADTQAKSAMKGANTAGIQAAADQAGTYDVASNPHQLGGVIGDLTFAVNDGFTNPVFGTAKSVSATTKADGTLQFDTGTPQGKATQATYDNFLQQQKSNVYQNAIMAVATDPEHHNVGNAVAMMEDLQKQGKLTPAAYRELSARLQGSYMNEQANSDVNTILSEEQHKFTMTPGNPGSTPVPMSNNLGNVKTSDEKSFLSPVTPVDGAIATANNLRGSNYQGLTLAQIAKKWTGESDEKANAWANTVHSVSGIDPNSIPNLNDPAVLNKMLQGMAAAEKSPEDRKLFTADVINQGVTASLSGKKANLNVASAETTSPSKYKTYSDYLSDIEPQLLQEARDRAAQKGLDATGQDLYAQRMENQINQYRSAQIGEVRSMTDQLEGIINKDNISNPDTLAYNQDPKVRQLWSDFQAKGGLAVNGVMNIMAEKARGPSSTYGTNFSSTLDDVLSGKIKTEQDLMSRVGKGPDSPLTLSGYQALQTYVDGMNPQQGGKQTISQGDATAQQQFFQGLKNQYTNGDPGFTAGHDAYEKQMMYLIPRLQQGLSQNPPLTYQQMFDPTSKDYIGSGGVSPPSAKQWQDYTFNKLMSRINATPSTGAAPAPVKTDPYAGIHFDNVTDLAAAIKSGKIERNTGIQYGLDHGLLSRSPQVPKPE